MTTSEYPKTPELDKQSEVIHSGKSGTVQEFYDWLREQGYVIARYRYTATIRCPGIRRDAFDDSNCQGGLVRKTITRFTYPEGIDVHLGETCPRCKGSGEIVETYENPPLDEVFIDPEQLMADFFGIDRNKIETERRAILDHLRSQQ